MPFAATRVSNDLGKPISSLFSYQFALVPNDSWTPTGFVSRPFGKRRLTHCPKLDIATLSDSDGNEIGYCLGIAVDRVGVRIENQRKLDLSIADAHFWSAIETLAVELAGRWLLLITDGTEQRIYGDASGMYNCVYDPVCGGVGSTLLLALMRDIEESEEVDYTQTMTHGLRMPFGRTRDAKARRLAVNHYLRLGDWTETRFWPTPGAFSEVQPGGETETIVILRDRLAAVFAGIVTSAPTAVGVSGGFDSRNLVAAGKDTLGHVKSFFSFTHNFNSRTDYLSATKVMKQLGYGVDRYQLAPEPYAADEVTYRNKCFGASTGYSIGLHAWTNIKHERKPDAGQLVMTGNAMEALRAAHWNAGNSGRLNPFRFGLKRCLFTSKFDSEFIAKWLPEYKNWISELPEDAQERYIDVLFTEHNLPNLGTLFFSHQENFWMCPFNDRKLIQLSASLPVGYRYSKRANEDFLKLAAPELSGVPFERDIRRRKWASRNLAVT